MKVTTMPLPGHKLQASNESEISLMLRRAVNTFKYYPDLVGQLQLMIDRLLSRYEPINPLEYE
jgi:hypothetical protein